eukprot:scaffold95780_cov40-Attheya_sp.AAC.1
MAFLKSTPLTFTGTPRLPEVTVQSYKISQLGLGRLLGISLGYVDIDGLSVGFGVGPAEGGLLGISLCHKLGSVEGFRLTLGSDDGTILVLGVTLGEAAGSLDNDGPTLGLIKGNMLFDGSTLGCPLGGRETE